VSSKLSVVIIARNEAHCIGACLASVKWADETVVVDSGSQDATIDIARRAGARVIQTPWLGFAATKNLGIDAAVGEWVLSIDADEEADAPLREEIAALLSSGPRHAAYRIRRESYYLGRLMRHGGWGSDWHTRLFRRDVGRFAEKAVHEYIVLSAGSLGRLTGTLSHHPYQDLASHVAKINAYTTLASDQMRGEGKADSPGTAVLRGAAAFVRMYLLRAGFLDGREGLLLAVSSAYYSFLKHAKLWALNNRS
jgi:glycosyltransferase involved in cell wall biosynthesis